MHGLAVQLPAELLGAAAAAQHQLSSHNAITLFQSLLAHALEAACPGKAVQKEEWVGPGGRSGQDLLEGWEDGWLQVDLAVPWLRLVVEANGPTHFFRNTGELEPTMLAPDRLLSRWDWQAISVLGTIYAKDEEARVQRLVQRHHLEQRLQVQR